MDTRIARVDPRTLTLLEVNARFMTQPEFARLVDNVKRDGCLTSVPLVCVEPDGSWLVLSGNHRTQAAVAAGLNDIDVMVIDAPLDEARKIALQLSHNSIAGQDDPAVLASLYEKIDDIDWRAYSGLDDKTLDLLVDTEVPAMAEANLDFATLTVLFLPNELDDAKETVEEALRFCTGADETWAARLADHDRILDLIDVTGKAHDVRNIAAGLTLLLDLARSHLPDLAEGWYDPLGDEPRHNGWVPTSTIFGHDMPATAATVARRAIQRVMDTEPGLRPWQALELIAADYLAG